MVGRLARIGVPLVSRHDRLKLARARVSDAPSIPFPPTVLVTTEILASGDEREPAQMVDALECASTWQRGNFACKAGIVRFR